MARLFITGKQSVARAIGSALAGNTRELERKENHFRIVRADGEVDWITWCGGHLVEMAPPELYDARYRKWRLEDLPILPAPWKWVEADPQKHPDQARQLAYIRQALEQASTVVHAGDPDREGQWRVDEVLSYCGYAGPVQRLLLPNLNGRFLRSALKAFEEASPDNQAFSGLSLSARTRSRIDWLYGLNMTRAYTLLGKHAGYGEVLSVGRMQTPLLGLVVQRDASIETFSPQPFYHLEAKFRKEEEYCHAVLQPDEKKYEHLNDEKLLEALVKTLEGRPAKLASREHHYHFESPPLLLDLSSLQIEGSRVLGYSGVEIIKIAKRLYEEFHLITYPLTDCRYAPEKLRLEADAVLDAVNKNLLLGKKNTIPMIPSADVWRQSAVWDNSKLTQHCGMMPTNHLLEERNLSEQEFDVYELIVRYYLCQFFPPSEEFEEDLVFTVGDYDFKSRKVSVVSQGWKQVISYGEASPRLSRKFPQWQAGDDVACESLEIKRHKTTPAARYTESELISAEIGTGAARAHMIESLFKRGYMIKGNKSIYSSGIGRDLIRALPAEAVLMDMSALWEQELTRIESLSRSDAEKAAEILMQKVEDKIRDFILQAQKKKNIEVHTPEEILGLEKNPKHHCPRCHSVLQLRKGRYGDFWGCSAYPACVFTARWVD